MYKMHNKKDENEKYVVKFPQRGFRFILSFSFSILYNLVKIATMLIGHSVTLVGDAVQYILRKREDDI